jgi:hypothetical protein
MARVKRPRKSAGDDARRAGQCKVTLWLDSGLAKRLRHAAVEDELELGQVAAPGIELALAGRFWTDRRRPAVRPAIAAASESGQWSVVSGQQDGDDPGRAAAS